ncbi:MAG: hypothetical protein JZU52_21920 [Lamprocystis purpurea]|jgi:hypothetical protein|uniref:hypothetical protein n=1 Tax=Lamprocystis purpurea TaxID=61598 RepID=UPI00037B9A70|nr:hypothetical protein [Lamprocystis purpurea]MBV5276178.1 hypothetical protein [Lamprocystis purpurea]
MIWKFLLTIVVMLGAYLVVRTRWRAAGRAGAPTAPPLLLSAGLVRTVAYALLGLMLAGSGWYLFWQWETGNAVLAVEVVNANTGAVTRYEARRRTIEGRGFRTLDGREIRLADVERMILEPASAHRLPVGAE